MPMMEEIPGLNLNSIVYATDFSLCSQNAGLYASRLARYFSSRLLVTHAFILTQAAMEIEIDSSLVSQQRKELLFMLTRKAFILASQTAEAVPVLLEGFPKKVLPELASEHAPSLIVLGTHGGGWGDVQHPDRLSDSRTRYYAGLDRVLPDQARKCCNPRTFVHWSTCPLIS